MTTFATMTADELACGYMKRSFSPVEVVRELLERIDRINEELNAFYLIDRDGALAAARRSEQRWVTESTLSPLDGVPTSIKDALASVGQPSFRGSAAHNVAARPASFDAPCVARMREAGMVFLGKTTMPDYGILASGTSSLHGTTRNPWNLSRTPGGSSAGAAASIAAGLNPVAVGTDIVGSIRLPASFCGLIGHKPSQGRVPYYFPNSPSLVAGPMARTVKDAALLMDIIVKPDIRDFTALRFSRQSYANLHPKPLKGLKLGILRGLGFGQTVDQEVLAALDRASAALERSGCHLQEVTPLFLEEDLLEAERFYKVRCRTELASEPSDMQSRAAVIAQWSAEAETMRAIDFYRTFNCLQSLRERAAHLVDDFDFLILPSVSRPAFDANSPGYSKEEIFQPWMYTFLFNLSEQPACSLTAGLTDDGLPIGIQIVGPRFDDRGVFELAFAFEELCPFAGTITNMIAQL